MQRWRPGTVYSVRIAARAERDLDAILTYITQGEGAEHAEAAHRWYVGLREAILSLKNQPLRGVRVAVSPGYRQSLYGNSPHVYRVIYRVEARTVYIVHIRHGARSGSGLR